MILLSGIRRDLLIAVGFGPTRAPVAVRRELLKKQRQSVVQKETMASAEDS